MSSAAIAGGISMVCQARRVKEVAPEPAFLDHAQQVARGGGDEPERAG